MPEEKCCGQKGVNVDTDSREEVNTKRTYG